jgi:hypothetical protein
MSRTTKAVAKLLALWPCIVFGASAQTAPTEGPVTIGGCRTIDQPGSYQLVGNLTADGNCLVVTADGVTIDLGGFAITGNGTGTAIISKPKGTGIPPARTVVRNGDISHFAVAPI